MPELRQDPISGQWVIIAPERARRPDEFGPAAEAQHDRACPFCAGNEHLTSTPLLEIPHHRDAATPWRLRVLANKYPAVQLAPNGDSAATGDSAADDTASGEAAIAALGCHEVVIESPRHVQSVTDISDEQLAEAVLVYRDRLAELKRDPRLVCGIVFKNMGYGGGATLEHIHSQIIALPTVPDRLRAELTGVAQWRERHGSCAFCDLVERELTGGPRLVSAGPRFVAFCPWAARSPFETWIVPREHASHFEMLETDSARELAALLRTVIAGVETLCGRQSYNYVIHSSPFDTPPGDHYHWHVEIIPRVTRLAGFELGSGWYINPVLPEVAAERLRKWVDDAQEKRSSSASLPIS